MDTRKLQHVGGSTYTVSLPKEWVRAAGLGAGDEIGVHAHDGAVIVQPPESTTVARATVRGAAGDGLPPERIVDVAYAAGVRELLIRADELTERERRTAAATARRRPGVSVSGEGDDLVVRTLLDAEEISLRQSVRQLSFVALSASREATAVVAGEREAVPTDDGGDEQAARLRAMVDRSLARGLERFGEVDALGLGRTELFELRETARHLAGMADDADRVQRLAAEPDGLPANTEPARALAAASDDLAEAAADVVVGDSGIGPLCSAFRAFDTVRDEADPGDDPRERLLFERVERSAARAASLGRVALRRALRDDELSEPLAADGR